MIRLFCFPSAGSSAAMYRGWRSAAGPSIEVIAVEPPGRGARFRERQQRELHTLLDTLGRELQSRLVPPFAFFGHSMGALVAYGLTRWLLDRGWTPPDRLFVSAFSAPHLQRPQRTHDAPRDQLLAQLQRLGGLPAELLREPELVDHLLGVLRADLAVCETCTPEPPVALCVPICAYGGDQDPMVPRGALDAWAEHTYAGLEVEQFPGGHFYLQEPRCRLVQRVAARLAGVPREEVDA